jgi:hypothetical protein
LSVGCSVRPLYNGSDGSCKLSNNALDEGPSSSSNGGITVDVIAERDGQKLRSHLTDIFRDLDFAREKYRLKVLLQGYEKQFAISDEGNAKRVSFIYVADVDLFDNSANVVMKKTISVSTSYNISHSHGEMTLSLYGRHNDALLKELSHRIVENVRMFITK